MIADYETTTQVKLYSFCKVNGKQPGEHVRVAQAIIIDVESTTPPLLLMLGVGALKGILNIIMELQTDIDTWEETTVWADYPKA